MVVANVSDREVVFELSSVDVVVVVVVSLELCAFVAAKRYVIDCDNGS